MAYDKAYATPVNNGSNVDVKVDFYNTVGFSEVSTLSYTIYPAKITSAPIVGVIEDVKFTQSGQAASVTLPGVLSGYPSDSYDVVLHLKNADGTIVAEETIGFSYSTSGIVSRIMQIFS